MKLEEIAELRWKASTKLAKAVGLAFDPDEMEGLVALCDLALSALSQPSHLVEPNSGIGAGGAVPSPVREGRPEFWSEEQLEVENTRSALESPLEKPHQHIRALQAYALRLETGRDQLLADLSGQGERLAVLTGVTLPQLKAELADLKAKQPAVDLSSLDNLKGE